MTTIIAIGNPGSGKSTILNSFAGQLLFQSGVSIGSGLTKQLESKTSKGITYVDTPGVADDTNKKAEQQKRDRELHNQQLTMMQKQIRQKEKEIEAARNDAERRAKLQEEQTRLQMEQQKQQHQAQMAALAAQNRRPPRKGCIVM